MERRIREDRDQTKGQIGRVLGHKSPSPKLRTMLFGRVQDEEEHDWGGLPVKSIVTVLRVFSIRCLIITLKHVSIIILEETGPRMGLKYLHVMVPCCREI